MSTDPDDEIRALLAGALAVDHPRRRMLDTREIDRALLEERKARATARSKPARAELPSFDPMPTQVCGARTRVKNSARGRPCQMTRLGAGNRCKFHGGWSTGPRTPEGRDRIALAQRERWRVWKAANPRLFPDVSPRQEQNIKRLYRQRQALKWIEKDEVRQSCIKTMEERAFLEQWQSKASRSETKEWLQYLLDQTPTGISTTPTANTGSEQARQPVTTGQKLDAQIERQPSHRIRRLQYAERQESIQAHAQELIERYGLDKRRPTVRVGYEHKKRR